MRAGYTEIAPGVGVPAESLREPAHLQSDHIDGPLLSWGGQLHWLTLLERLALAVGTRTLDQIAANRFLQYRDWHP